MALLLNCFDLVFCEISPALCRICALKLCGYECENWLRHPYVELTRGCLNSAGIRARIRAFLSGVPSLLTHERQAALLRKRVARMLRVLTFGGPSFPSLELSSSAFHRAYLSMSWPFSFEQAYIRSWSSEPVLSFPGFAPECCSGIIASIPFFWSLQEPRPSSSWSDAASRLLPDLLLWLFC